LGHPDAVILPGSKTSIADLIALEKSGMAQKLQDYAAAGGTIIGICGGFQMLGQRLCDPEGLEGDEGYYPGLNLLPLNTILTAKKITRQRQVTSLYPQVGLPVFGYEIHQGRTLIVKSQNSPTPSICNPIFDDPNLGVVNDSRSIWGCYLHGLFDNGPWRRTWLNQLRHQRGLSSLPTGVPDYRQQRESMLDSIADLVEAHLDLKPVLPQ